MPELPEVETIRRDLEAARGKKISSVRVLNRSSVRGGDVKQFAKALRGRRFKAFHRRGKHLIIELDSGQFLVIHLKMTGVIQLQSDDDSLPRAARVIFNFSRGERMVYSDQRKFGSIQLTSAPHLLPEIRYLGPEPLGDDFTWRTLADRLRGRRSPIKPLLLDQKVLAGLGNIYVCEALHRSGIRPDRPALSLSSEEVRRLHGAIRRVLKEAIAARGSSVDTYRDGRGQSGWYQVRHRVYGRQGHRCSRCGRPVVRETLRGRGTYWCPGCQH